MLAEGNPTDDGKWIDAAAVMAFVVEVVAVALAAPFAAASWSSLPLPSLP